MAKLSVHACVPAPAIRVDAPVERHPAHPVDNAPAGRVSNGKVSHEVSPFVALSMQELEQKY